MNKATDGNLSQRLAESGAVGFDELPPDIRLRAFEVDYAHLRTYRGGDMLVTRYGWPILRKLLPENWYADEWYRHHGERLPGSTGHVYRVPTRPECGRSIDMVVKFSRVAQEVPLEVATSFPDTVSADEIANARFNSPVEEFGLTMEMRRGAYGPKDIRVLAQCPLAIYAPPEQHELWQLGRTRGRFHVHRHLLAQDQEEAVKAIELDIKRQYVLLYSWIDGKNAEEALLDGDITDEQFRELTPRVIQELRAKGFRVLDNKPKHFIVRPRRRDGKILSRHDRIVYGLVDFELLQRTPEYHHEFKSIQRAKYWEIQSHRQAPAEPRYPSYLQRINVLGVDYMFGNTPDGGQVWVVGNAPDLFDFFLPERWRRTPRLKLSMANEVYHTRTRDNIHVVYRRSRVGERPHVDPFYGQGKRIRQYGYNSPFEEVAIAERLREAGIATTYPRAVYRTGHLSTRAGYIRDDRRYDTHADLLTPEADPEPILSSDHDYYTLWGYFRGVDPQKHYRSQGHWGFVDLAKAREDGLLTQEQHEQIIQSTHRRLAAAGIEDTQLYEHAIIIPFDKQGAFRQDAHGELDVTFSMDALTVHEYGLLSERRYRDLIRGVKAELDAVRCEAINLSGNHLLLSMNPDGELKTNGAGQLQFTLCNFELLCLPLR